jgi:hypothetical protein
MIALLISTVISIWLFFSLLRLRRRPKIEGGAQALLKARNSLDLLQDGLLPESIVSRVFTTADYDYVSRVATADVQQLFMQERKRLALLWVGHILLQIETLKEFHLGSARFYTKLSPRTEMRLALEFLALSWVCRLLQLSIYVRGPYAMPGMVQHAAAMASRICDTSSKVVTVVSPARVSTLGKDSAQNVSAL